MVTLEPDPRHADVTHANFAAAGLSGRIELRLGAALKTLLTIEAEGGAPFHLVFIDADKPSNPAYLAFALRLSRPGTEIVADNVVRQGAITEADSDDTKVLGTRALFDALEAEPHLSATAI